MTGLQKPGTVEVGGWWKFANDPYPVHVVMLNGEHAWADSIVPVGSKWSGRCDWFLTDYRWAYLGNGENPAPSDKMVETLAKHYTHVRYGMHSVLRDEEQAWVRRGVLRCLTAWESILLPTHGDIAVLSLYGILRKRGEW